MMIKKTTGSLLSQLVEKRERLVDWAWRIITVSGLVGIAAYFAAKQAVTPHRRYIKVAVFLWLLMLMLRFDMIYAVFLFTVLFFFPSGVSIGSTNSILMTIIPLVWLIRASSTKVRLLTKTPLDYPIILLILAYVISFFNVETQRMVVLGVSVCWRLLAALAFFYLIVRFVDDEIKFRRMTKVVAVAATLVMLTAIIELFFPGAEIIPGWIGLKTRGLGTGTLTYRIEGIRVGGPGLGHGALSDFASISIFFMIYHFLRSKNPLEKSVWATTSVMTFIVMLATANRGAILAISVGVIYILFLLRKKLSMTKYVLIVTSLVLLFLGAQMALERYTYATSIYDRVMGTTFKSGIPDTRVGAWVPVFWAAFDHVFIGHGPRYEIGPTGLPWPHNAYLFYFYTVGLFGLGAFIFIVVRVVKLSLLYRKPDIQNTFMGDIMLILHVQLVMSLIEQLRTDHQRDDVYVYFIWLLFGLITAAAQIITKHKNQSREENSTTGAVAPSDRPDS